MDFKTKDDIIADAFVELMKQKSQQSNRESASDTVFSTLILNQGAIPQIAKELEAPYVRIVAHFSRNEPVVGEGRGFERQLY